MKIIERGKTKEEDVLRFECPECGTIFEERIDYVYKRYVLIQGGFCNKLEQIMPCPLCGNCVLYKD